MGKVQKRTLLRTQDRSILQCQDLRRGDVAVCVVPFQRPGKGRFQEQTRNNRGSMFFFWVRSAWFFSRVFVRQTISVELALSFFWKMSKRVLQNRVLTVAHFLQDGLNVVARHGKSRAVRAKDALPQQTSVASSQVYKYVCINFIRFTFFSTTVGHNLASLDTQPRRRSRHPRLPCAVPGRRWPSPTQPLCVSFTSIQCDLDV